MSCDLQRGKPVGEKKNNHERNYKNWRVSLTLASIHCSGVCSLVRRPWGSTSSGCCNGSLFSRIRMWASHMTSYNRNINIGPTKWWWLADLNWSLLVFLSGIFASFSNQSGKKSASSPLLYDSYQSGRGYSPDRIGLVYRWDYATFTTWRPSARRDSGVEVETLDLISLFGLRNSL